MKKTLLIIGIIIVALAAIGFVGFKMLAKEKTPISADTFYYTMSAKGYIVTDGTSAFEKYGDYVSKAYLAQTTGYQIEFFELSNVENAISMYNYNKSIFEIGKTNNSASATTSINNYSQYSLSTNGKYKYLSRIDNTFIYVDVDENYKDTVKDIIKELGY